MRKIYLIHVFVLSTLFTIKTSAQEVMAFATSNQGNAWLETSENTASDLVRLSATVIEDAIELFWETPNEQSISDYELQRSVNGATFVPIARFRPIGEESMGGAYLHLDESHFVDETVYYRVKSLSGDGRYEYSTVQIVDLQLTRTYIQLASGTNMQPNFISVNNETLDRSKSFKLLNSENQMVKSFKAELHQISVNCASLRSGIYFLSIPLKDGTYQVERFVKQ